MEITPDGQMWIIDNGNTHDDYLRYQHRCPPKLIIFDINTHHILRQYTFPDDVVNHNNSFLNDIVVDPINKIGFITDLKPANPQSDLSSISSGGIVVYNFNTNVSHRYSDPVMAADGIRSTARNVTINGYTVQTDGGISGIALSPDLNWIYFCPLSSYRTYRVLAFNVKMYTDDSSGSIQFIGNRSSQMDGMSFSNESILYFGSLGENAIHSIPYEFAIEDEEQKDFVKHHEVEVMQNATTMQWVNSFGWGEDGNLYFITNKLHRFILGNMDWNGGDGANFRVHQVYVGANSYMMYDAKGNDHISGASIKGLGWIVAVIIGVVLFSGLAVLFLSYRWRKQMNQEHRSRNAKFLQLDNNLDL